MSPKTAVPQISPEEAERARALVALFEKQEEDRLAVPAVMSTGSMHDGCKRLRDGDWETVGYETDHAATLPTLTKSDQMPVAPSEQKIDFPPGVVSIADWGTTVCRLPQVAALDVTYYELTQMPSQRGYCTWITNHGESKGGRAADFARYLKAVGYKKSLQGQKGEECYPGTSEIREKKK